jgi:phosphate transport system substrate-binding protein
MGFRGQVVLGVIALLALSSTSVVAQTAQPASLTPYRPEQIVSGTIRNFGGGLGGLIKLWEMGFQKVQPGVRFDDKLPTSDAAIPALVTGAADLAPDGSEPIITETLSFFETFGYDLTSITVASGAYDVDGHTNGLVVYVNKDNPLSRLTMQQLDGVFGAERNGGLAGFKWTLGGARGPQANIRTWGQLGLGGEWADKPIQTYGHAPSGTARFFQLKVLHNSDKWNPNYREYVETGSKMIGDDDARQLGGLKHMLADELAGNKYGIAWTVLPQARGVSGIKPVALAAREGGPYILPSRESFQSRTYPLARSIYIYLNRAPNQPIDPKLKEFLRYILSREGQEIVAKDGGYLPLPANAVREQLAKLE